MGGACSRREPSAGTATEKLVPGGRAVSSSASGAGDEKCHIVDEPAIKKPASLVEGFGTSSRPAPSKLVEYSSGQVCLFSEVAHNERELQQQRVDNHAKAASALREIHPEAKLTKLCSVNGRLLFVIDNLIPDTIRRHLFDTLQGDAFRRTEFARPDTREFRHHIVEYQLMDFRRNRLFHLCESVTRLLFPEKELEVYRIYTNSVMYGDVAFVHRDSCDDDHVTILVYPNPEWSSELGGETVFYNEDGEIHTAIEPRPGRVCLFHGAILHKGSPPSRLFYGSRYTTAFKLSPVCERQHCESNGKSGGNSQSNGQSMWG